MPAKEERIREVPREQSRRAGAAEQGAHRGAQITQGAVLPEGRLTRLYL